MGRVQVIGVAKVDCPSDQCRVKVGFEIARETADEASRVASENCERLLQRLRETGIDHKSIENDFDRLDKRNGYKAESIAFQATRSLWFSVEADMGVVNAIRDVIEEEFEEAVYWFNFETTREPELNNELVRRAIADSRKRAEILASSMGCRVAGIESANLSDDGEAYDAVDGPNRRVMARMGAPESSHPLSDSLKPAMIELSQKVNIVWLIEPAE